MRISDWSSDVCSSDLLARGESIDIRLSGGGGMFDPFTRPAQAVVDDVEAGVVTPAGALADYGVVITEAGTLNEAATQRARNEGGVTCIGSASTSAEPSPISSSSTWRRGAGISERFSRRPRIRPWGRSAASGACWRPPAFRPRSEEHTSELQSLMRISYAVFCLKKKKKREAKIP